MNRLSGSKVKKKQGYCILKLVVRILQSWHSLNNYFEYESGYSICDWQMGTTIKWCNTGTRDFKVMREQAIGNRDR